MRAQEFINIPIGRKGRATTEAPALLYHNLRGRSVDPSGIKGYQLRPSEKELEQLFAEPSPDGYVWLAPKEGYFGSDYITVDATKLDPNNLRYTGQSEGYLLHKGSIPASAIIS